MWPAYSPSMAMWMMVPTLWQSRYSMPSCFMSLALPAATLRAVHLGHDAVAADLLDVRHAAAVDRLAVGLLQALADRDGTRRISASAAYSSSFARVQLVVVHGRDLEHALRQGAGLVKDDDLRLGQGLPDSWSP